MTEFNAMQVFEEWNSALQTGDPAQVTKLYDSSAVLLPTVSDQVRRNHEEIQDYFVSFLAKKPVGRINQQNVRQFDTVATSSGVYTFTFGDGSEVQARYTYVYQWNGERWLIIEHHSSQMPEGLVSVDQVAEFKQAS